jgi:hypothetical protein
MKMAKAKTVMRRILGARFWLLLQGMLLVFFVSNGFGQDVSVPAPARHPAKGLPMESRLYDLDEVVRLQAVDPVQAVEARGFQASADGMIKIEIINRFGSFPLDADVIMQFGGRVTSEWRNQVCVWLPPHRLTELAKSLPAGFWVTGAMPPITYNEGPGLIGSDEYIANGADGSGVKIAIIDVGFRLLYDYQSTGDAPSVIADSVDYTQEGGIAVGTSHGTGCLALVYDHAPNAMYHLYKVWSKTEFSDAIWRAIVKDVDVISMSIGWIITGWADDSGSIHQDVEVATNQGILLFNAVGNHAEEHWQGSFSDPDGNNWHNWSGTDETLSGLSVGIPPGASVAAYMQWNTSALDLDLYMYADSGMTDLLDLSTNGRGFWWEWVEWTNPGPDWQWGVHLGVIGEGSPELEIFTNGWEPEYVVSAGAIGAPSNSTQPNAISVGAVHRLNYDEPEGSDPIEDYSSRGPTNSGNLAPDITAPTYCHTRGPFTLGGTSGAAPNAAGAAAAFWSSAPHLNPDAVRYLLLENAGIFKDWGPSGVDYTYGYGGMKLPPLCIVDPDSLDFGIVLVSDSLDMYFDIINNGDGILSGTVSETCSFFDVVEGGGSYSLAAGETLPVTVRFKPGAGGSFDCWIETGAPCADVYCTGDGDDVSSLGIVSGKRFHLYQNYPNPFNPTTHIRYDVPASGGRVTLRIYNVEGRLVRTLINEDQSPGQKMTTWHGRNDQGQSVATGVYFYRMTAPGFTLTKKMVLLK